MSIDLKITRTIRTGIMYFRALDEERYGEIETALINDYEAQDFATTVSLNVSDSDFCQYWLSSDIAYEDDFKRAVLWLLARMESLDTSLDYVS